MGSNEDHFIQKAIKHPGFLHKALHVKEGSKIPKGKIEKAEHSKNKHIASAARLAQTLGKLRPH
jgi:hypothetical protein